MVPFSAGHHSKDHLSGWFSGKLSHGYNEVFVWLWDPFEKIAQESSMTYSITGGDPPPTKPSTGNRPAVASSGRRSLPLWLRVPNELR